MLSIKKTFLLLLPKYHAAPSCLFALANREISKVYKAATSQKAWKINNYEKIGTVQGALLTYKSLQIVKPELILNVGTCGAIHDCGIKALDIVRSNEFVIYHDRFSIEALENYSVGKFPCERLNFFKDAIPVIFGTSNSLIINQNNIESIKKYRVSCLDMEAAAVAEVCQEEKIKFFALKVVTDIVSLNKNDSDIESQFVKNFKSAMEKIGVWAHNVK